jgi:hypothetical protein
MTTKRGFGLTGILVAIVIILTAGMIGVYVVKDKKEVFSTKDWKTYHNERHGYQLTIPKDWGSISVYDGSFTQNIDSDSEGYLVLGDKNNSEGIIVNVFENEDVNIYSTNWYIDFYVDKEYIEKVININDFGATEIFIPTSNYATASANRYTYLIEHESSLFEVGFLNKSDTTDQILSTFTFIE